MKKFEADMAIALLFYADVHEAYITQYEGMTCVAWVEKPGELHVGCDLSAVEAWCNHRAHIIPMIDQALDRDETEVHVAADDLQ